MDIIEAYYAVSNDLLDKCDKLADVAEILGKMAGRMAEERMLAPCVHSWVVESYATPLPDHKCVKCGLPYSQREPAEQPKEET